MMQTLPTPNLNVILDGYDRFKICIQHVYKEAMLRWVDMNLMFHLSDLLTKLYKVKQRAEQNIGAGSFSRNSVLRLVVFLKIIKGIRNLLIFRQRVLIKNLILQTPPHM